MATKDDMEEDYDEDDEDMVEDQSLSPEHIAKSVITGRGITLQNLIVDRVIEPGNAVLSLKYLGRKFIADLLPNGKIQTPATKEVFATPSAWAMHCKKQINPEKKSGCGWSSIMYKGRKLDSWKTTWFRRHHSNSPARNTKDTPSPVRAHREILSPTHQPSDSPVWSNRDIFSMSPARNSQDILGGSPARSFRDTESPRSVYSDGLNGESGRDGVKSHRHGDGRGSITKEEERSRGQAESDMPLDLTPKPAHTSTPFHNGKTSHRSSGDSGHKLKMEVQEEALNLSLKEPPADLSTHTSERKRTSSETSLTSSETGHKLSEHKSARLTPPETNNNSSNRVSVRHATLRKRSDKMDPNVLVKCETFKNLEKVQPFTVSVTSNATLLMDFHSHLTSSEVVGYLGGKWDQETQHLSIIQAFPCHCRLADTKRAIIAEEEIQTSMSRQGLSLVGWYHSHPYCQADPTVKDIDCQMSYQLRMKGKGSTYFPCVGCVISPYNRETSKKESSLQMFMVMPPLENQPSDYGIPVSVRYSLRQNQSVTEDLLSVMKTSVDFYKNAPDFLKFRQTWQPSISYMEKLKGSLARRLPEDQMVNGTFLDFVQHLLLASK